MSADLTNWLITLAVSSGVALLIWAAIAIAHARDVLDRAPDTCPCEGDCWWCDDEAAQKAASMERHPSGKGRKR